MNGSTLRAMVSSTTTAAAATKIVHAMAIIVSTSQTGTSESHGPFLFSPCVYTRGFSSMSR